MPRYAAKFSQQTGTAAIHVATCPQGDIQRGFTVLLFDTGSAKEAQAYYAEREDFAARGIPLPTICACARDK